jgi:hypothetical protein
MPIRSPMSEANLVAARPRPTGAVRWVTGLVAAAVVTVSATLPGSGASADPAAPAASTPVPYGTLWVLNASSLTAYQPGLNGNVRPTVSIKGGQTHLARAGDLAVTAAGALWVTDASDNALNQFAAAGHGNVAPALTIRGAKTMLDNPIACSVDRIGNLWVLNDKPSAGTASITEYAPAARGNVAPILRIAGSNTALFPASAIAAAPGGRRVWVTHVEAGSGLNAPALQAFSTSRAGNVPAVARILGRATTLDYPAAIAIDSIGDLVVSNDPDSGRTSAVLTFAPNTQGNRKPVRSISGAAAGVVRPGYLAVDATGNIWVPNPRGAAVRRFRHAANGNVAPRRMLRGTLTGIVHPRAAAVFLRVASRTPKQGAAGAARRADPVRWWSPGTS